MTRQSVGVLVTLLVVALFGLLLVQTIAANRLPIRVIDGVAKDIAETSHWSTNLVRGLVIIVTIPFFWAVAKFTKGLIGYRTLTPSLRLYTNFYGIVIVVYSGVFFLTLYFASRASFVSTDGRILKWCASTPEGIVAYDSPGKDSIYGIELHECTSEEKIALREGTVEIRRAQRITVPNPKDHAFFDSVTHKPRVWYHRYPDGTYDLYDQAGAHPVTGEDLLPMDATTVAILMAHPPKVEIITPPVQIIPHQEAQPSTPSEAPLEPQDASQGQERPVRVAEAREATRAKPTVIQSTEVSGFRLDLQRCVASGSQVTCSLLVTSKDADREFAVRSSGHPASFDVFWVSNMYTDLASRAFDDTGSQYSADESKLGGGNDVETSRLVAGVPCRVTIIFRGVTPSAQRFALLEVVAAFRAMEDPAEEPRNPMGVARRSVTAPGGESSEGGEVLRAQFREVPLRGERAVPPDQTSDFRTIPKPGRPR